MTAPRLTHQTATPGHWKILHDGCPLATHLRDVFRGDPDQWIGEGLVPDVPFADLERMTVEDWRLWLSQHGESEQGAKRARDSQRGIRYPRPGFDDESHP